LRELARVARHAVLAGDRAVRVAENRVIEREGFGESFIGLRRIAACREVFDVELTQLGAALTERLALRLSPSRERFGIPGEHHRVFAPKVR
jgi:hypothetical protein